MSNFSEGLDMLGLTSAIRSGRVITKYRWSEPQKSDLTVFLGLYNASLHIGVIKETLYKQDWQGCNLVIVDNNSSDDSWTIINEVSEELSCPVLVAKNPVNVGGIGSWFANLDLATADWVATMHQDDYYYPEHVQNLRTLALQSSPEVAMCTTSMDRWTGSKNIELFPRANWVLDASEPATVFLSHLRFHALPFPAAAFRKCTIESLPISWHDTSFGDTEMVLRLAADFKFVSHPTPTMAYRENPESESHILRTLNKVNGQRIGLLKVFGSDAFGRLARKIPLDDRDDFFVHAIESIDIRLDGSDETDLTKRFLAENLSIHWNYSSPAVNHFLQAIYEAEGNAFAAALLSGRASKTENESSPDKSLGDLVAFSAPKGPGRATTWLFRLLTKNLMLLSAFSGKRRDLNFKWRRPR